jgi:hypothetical protein
VFLCTRLLVYYRVLLGGWAFLSQCEGARFEGLARGQGAAGQRQASHPLNSHKDTLYRKEGATILKG